MAAGPPAKITLISALNPPSLTRAWQSTPHPSRPMVATCASDKTVRIYSLTSFTQLSTIAGGHERSVRSAAWKPGLTTESQLATGSFDRSVCMWRRDHGGDGAEGAAEDAADAGAGATEGLEQDFTSTGPRQRQRRGRQDSPNSDEADPSDWTYFCVLDGPDSEIKSVSWSAGGNLLALSSRDKSVWVWEEEAPEEYSLVAMLQEHTGDVKSVAWHPQEELLASASYDDDVRLWRECADEWECVSILAGHGSTVWMVGWEGADAAAGAPVDGEALAVGAASVGAAAHEDGVTAAHGGVGVLPPLLPPDGAGPMDGVESTHRAAADHSATGHSATHRAATGHSAAGHSAAREAWLERRRLAGPRLATCSDDRTVRVWRRVPRSRDPDDNPNALSTIRTDYHLEDWVCEAVLPAAHDMAVYAVAWSERSGRIASTGGDGKLIVYEERWRGDRSEVDGNGGETAAAAAAGDGGQTDGRESSGNAVPELTKWLVVAEVEEAHDVFEVNHVAWALRADKGKSGRKDEEVLITTGDDGNVKVWALE